MLLKILKRAALVLVFAVSFLFAANGSSVNAGTVNSGTVYTETTSNVVYVLVYIDGNPYWEVWIDGIKVAVIPQED